MAPTSACQAAAAARAVNCATGASNSSADLAALLDEMVAHLPDPAAVEAQLLRGGEEGLTHRQLRRWLVARGRDPARAAHDLAAHAAWRATWVPEGRVREGEITRQIAQQKMFIQGVDRQGRAVTLLDAGNHLAGDAVELQRFFCYCADAAIALADPLLNPEGRVVFIIDVGGFGLKNFDLTGAKVLFGMLHQHYVERMSKLYLYNAGPLLMQLYKLVTPFIDPVTRSKLVFLPRSAAEASVILAQEIDIAILPRSLGGSSERVPVERVWPDILAARKAAAAAGAASGLERSSSGRIHAGTAPAPSTSGSDGAGGSGSDDASSVVSDGDALWEDALESLSDWGDSDEGGAGADAAGPPAPPAAAADRPLPRSSVDSVHSHGSGGAAATPRRRARAAAAVAAASKLFRRSGAGGKPVVEACDSSPPRSKAAGSALAAAAARLRL